MASHAKTVLLLMDVHGWRLPIAKSRHLLVKMFVIMLIHLKWDWDLFNRLVVKRLIELFMKTLLLCDQIL